MPEGLSEEALMALLRLRYGAEELEAAGGGEWEMTEDRREMRSLKEEQRLIMSYKML